MRRKKSKFDVPVMEIDVRGVSYKVYLYPKQLFNSRHPGSEAIHTSSPNTLQFSEQYCTLIHVSHELFHAYLASSFFHSQVNQAAEDLEEVACETFATFSQVINLQAQDILKELKKEITRRKDGNIEKDRKE